MDRIPLANLILQVARPIYLLSERSHSSLSFFYEIRSTAVTVLKRTGGFPDREACDTQKFRPRLKSDSKLFNPSASTSHRR